MTPDPRAHRAIAHQVIADNRYLTLATADADGIPWATPVYFAAQGSSRYYWVSSPDSRHSRNIAARPVVALTIFDSQVAIGRAEAVYVSALADLAGEAELPSALQLLNGGLPTRQHLTPDDLRPTGALRVYRATAVELSILIRGGSAESEQATDHRKVVPLD